MPSVSIETFLSESDSRHLALVLRLKAGDPLIAISKLDGTEYEAIIVDCADRVKIKILKVLKLPSSKSNSVVKSLIFCLGKAPVNDLVCEKACELGAGQIIFWQSERSVIKLSEPKDIAAKISRWSKIAESAARQCSALHIPEIKFVRQPVELANTLQSIKNPEDILLVCSLSEGTKALREIDGQVSSVHIAIGPAGDFTPHEEEFLKSLGFIPVSLGPLRLRSETAALAALAIAQGLWGPA